MSSTMKPKYPHVRVPLVGLDGNAIAILGRVSRALREAKVPCDEINKYMKEATGGSYDNLLQTTLRYVEVI